MKQMYLNSINAQERFENGPKTVRVKSRIGSRLVRKSLDSFLTRFCLISLFLIFMGGFTTEVWADDCTYTISNKKSSITTYLSHKKNGLFDSNKYKFYANNEIGSIDNQYGISKIYIKATMERIAAGSGCKIKFQYKNSSGSWVDLTGESELAGYSAAIPTSTAVCDLSGSSITSAISGATAFRIVETRQEEYSKNRTITINDFYVVMAKTLSGSEETMTFSDQTYNTTSSAKTRKFTFSNEVTGKSITISENTNSTEFPATLTKSGDCTGSVTVSVKFKPSAQGDRSGSITVSGDCGSKTFSVSGTGLRANSSLEMNDGAVNVSIAGINSSILDLSTLLKSKTGNGGITYKVQSATGENATTSTASIAADGKTFSATECGTYTIRATQAQTDQYNSSYDDFTVTVNKLQPTFEWWNANGATHIYASDTLKNVAQAKYNGNNVVGLNYSYGSNSKIVVVDGTKLRVQNAGFTSATNVTISVSTDSTDYYKAGSDTHTYLIEPKATPVFKLDGVDLPETPVKELTLLIGETANMTFENTDESNNRFTYPTNPTFVSYKHDSVAHTGVIKAVKAGNEEIQFHQTGTTTIFEHTRSIHVFVRKHPVVLTTLMGGIWKVDSVYDGTLYSLSDTPEDGEPVQNDVTISSSNKNVVDYVNGHWKAVGAGSATLTIAQKNNDYWTGDTITTTITVVKHTPEFTWHIPATVNYNRSFAEPVSSTNTDEGCTFTYVSNNTAAINYVNGALRTFEKSANNVAITVKQAGNYKWAERSETYYVNVEKLANHVELTVNSQAIYNAVYSNNSGEVYYDATSGIRLGGSSGSVFPINDKSIPAYNWDDKYIIITFEGVPDKVSFSYRTNNSSATGANWYVQESANGVNGWSEIWSNGDYDKTSYASVTKSLKPSTRYLKLCYSGNFAGYFKNVHITERTEITGVKTVDFGATDAGSNPTDKTSNISWYNVNPLTLTIEGENASQFTVSPAEIASAKDAFAENVPLTISYKHNRAAVKDTATLVITDGVTTKRIGLRGTTNKLTPSITWKENLTPMQRGVGVKNPATSPVALTYTSTDPTVVNVIGDSIAPLKKGNATITASFDGTSDPMYNSNSSTIDVEVTDMHVQHINWPQTFTRLKYTTNPALSDKNTADFPLTATVSYYDLDNKVEVALDRTITFTSGNNNVVKVLNGNILHVVGLGETTLSAHVDGVADEYLEATITRTVKVREPSTDCDTYIVEDAHASMATGVTSFNGEETVIDLNGQEPGYVSFSAWREIIKVVIEYTGGDLYLSQYVNGQWSDDLWHNGLVVDNPKDFGPIALDRHATKIKLYKKTGSLGIHAFSDCNVTLARYLELDNTEGKTSTDIYFSTTDAKPGVAKTKSFTVNYSNITDQLQVDYEGSDKFSVTPTTIGDECGDKGKATVQVTFLSNDVEHYEGTITIHNLNQSVTVHLSADVDKHHQQITWNPVTELKTTDAVTFNATTSAAAAGLNVRYQVVEGDAATVNAETGALTIIKDGTVTIKATAAGNDSYYDAEPVSKTFTISKVTPTITTIPMAQTMTMPNTSLADCELTGGAASVEGSFAWADNTINATYNNTGYTVTFTPENTNWYSSVSCVVVVPVNKMVQTITWNFTELEMYPNAQITFDASTNAGLPVSYSSSDETVAYVDGNNKLLIIRGGEVTITASQSGNETYAAAEPVSKTLIINRFEPTIVTLPNASTMKIGRSLSDASLTGGLAQLNNEPVEGSFTWVDGNTTNMNVAGTFTKQVVFNPANSNYYEPVYGYQDVTVEKYAPVITHTLQGSDIDYGQTLSQSQLSGEITATDNVKIPREVVSGTYGWKDGSAILNAGSQQATVVFSPSNTDWYQPVEFEVSVTVNPIVADYTAVAHLVLGQTLSEARLDNTSRFNGQEILGSVEWDDSAEDMSYLGYRPILNDSRTFTVKFYSVPGSNFADGTAICTLDVLEGYVFNGEGTNDATSWNEDENWSTGTQPEETDLVVISANVDVTGNVEVGGLTINAGNTVTVKDGAILTIGSQSSLYRDTYGDIHVEEGGKLVLTTGTVDVNNLYLDASLGNNTIPANSGQIRNPQQIDVNGDAFFDLILDPNDCSYGWYDFTVPFPVDNRNGISRYQDNLYWKNDLRTEQNYAIMKYHEDIRANNQYAWKKYYGIMQPGICYTISVDDTSPLYRFRMQKGANFNTGGTVALTATDGKGGDVHKGWNCVGNGTMTHARFSSTNVTKLQIYDHASNRYNVKDDFSTLKLPVGTAIFVQASEATNMLFTDVNPVVAEAPMRTQGRSLDEYLLSFSLENDATNVDRLYLSASEDASANYEIGHDLAKFGVSTKVAQIWADAYGQKLCDVEAPLVADQAIIPISLYAAQTGTYTLDVVRGPQDASLYLMYNGAVIWNLSQSAYTFDLTRGTNSAYSLLLTAEAPAISTGCDAISGEKTQQVEKILLNGQLYILRDGQMYDATGKKVK